MNKQMCEIAESSRCSPYCRFEKTLKRNKLAKQAKKCIFEPNRPINRRTGQQPENFETFCLIVRCEDAQPSSYQWHTMANIQVKRNISDMEVKPLKRKITKIFKTVESEADQKPDLSNFGENSEEKKANENFEKKGATKYRQKIFKRIFPFSNTLSSFVVRYFKVRKNLLPQPYFPRILDVRITVLDYKNEPWLLYDFESGPTVTRHYTIGRVGSNNYDFSCSQNTVLFIFEEGNQKFFVDESIVNLHFFKLRSMIVDAVYSPVEITVPSQFKPLLFKTALKILYNQDHKFRMVDIPEILELAQFYRIEFLLNKCAQSLAEKTNKHFSFKRKVEFAYKYDLQALKIHLLTKLTECDQSVLHYFLINFPDLPQEFTNVLRRRHKFLIST